jgi:hypothetical protein
VLVVSASLQTHSYRSFAHPLHLAFNLQKPGRADTQQTSRLQTNHTKVEDDVHKLLRDDRAVEKREAREKPAARPAILPSALQTKIQRTVSSSKQHCNI